MSGMHYVVEFVLLEMVLVGVAFLIYARHAGDRKHIAPTRDWLLVELIEVERVRQSCLDRRRHGSNCRHSG